ncbi:MAG: GNAT family N-acetyltransferase [Geminicoccaceae bacterium]|nr:MAG: GNAT family N-acetyltransferase [Geminicoccaceae bacterium]
MDTRFGFPRWRPPAFGPLSTLAAVRSASGPAIRHVSDDLELRLAVTRADIRAAQALRFRVFHNEMGAAMRGRGLWLRRDIDRFDRYCDHLLVIDRSAQGRSPKVVGTYRLLRGDVARMRRGFYTAAEFDLGPLMGKARSMLELGRSCVDPAYRSRGVMQILWKGIADYLLHYDLKLMLGCASFPGTNPDAVAHALTFLHDRHLMPAGERPRALPHRYVEMNRVPLDQLDPDRVRREMPPLVKGYLRLGGRVGEGAVIDKAFNTIDVCLVLPVEAVTQRYVKHYTRDSSDQAAA